MTALLATPQAATATAPPSMLLNVTAAPNPPAAGYASNFAAGVDGWTNGGSATLTGNVTPPVGTTKTLRVQGPATTADATAQRALTGQTVAATYRYKATVQIARGEVKLVAKDTAGGTVLAQTAFVTYANPNNKTVSLTLDYVPTAAAVTIQLVTHQTTAFGGSTADVYAYNISTTQLGAWAGTTVYRTDANGTDVPVREDVAGQDTAGGVMTLTDWEAALNGPVAYRVVDGNGVSTAAAVVSHAELRRNLVPNPSFEVDLTGWTVGGPATATRVTTGTAGRGSAYVKLTRTGAGAISYAMAPQPAVPGKFYTVSYDGKTSSGALAGGGYLTFYSAAMANLGDTFVQFAGGTSWQRTPNVATALAPVGTAFVVWQFYTSNGVAGDAWWLDGVMIEAADAAGDYFDGDYPDVGPVVHFWTGPVGNSASVETGDVAALGAWITLPATAVPSAGAAGAPQAVKVPLLTDYNGAAQPVGVMHQVIGRSDRIGNPGPLSTRDGTLTVWEPDYPTTKAARVLLSTGATAMFRQPTHPGLDLYFVPQRVDERPQSELTTTRRWALAIDYSEVVAP